MNSASSSGTVSPRQAAAGGGTAPGPEEASSKSKKGYDFSKSSIENITKRRFNFGPAGGGSQPLNVDQTLAHLFDTLSVECSNILVHPQWHHFRHIRMLRNDQVRLSNGIWRSWHLQFQKRRKPLYCRFDIDGELAHHTKQEAVVLEGKYWKRHPNAVASEYRKWRYYREKKQVKNVDPALDEVRAKAAVIFEELMTCEKKGRQPQEMQVDPPRPSFLQTMEELADKFPMDSPRVPLDAYTTYDMMVQQPNLDMLNPMMDDFLNKMSEPMDIMMSRPPPMAPFVGGAPLFTASPPLAPQSLQAHQSLSYPSPQPPSLQPQQVQMQLSLLDNSAPKDVGMTQDAFSTAFSLLSGYQDVSMTEQPRYSPSSFLSMSHEQPKAVGEGSAPSLMNIQQAGNYAMKCEDQLNGGGGTGGGGSGPSCDDGFYRNTAGSYQADMGASIGGKGLFRTPQQKAGDGVGMESVVGQFYQPNAGAGELVSRQPDAGSIPPHLSPSPAAALSGPQPQQQRRTQHAHFQLPPASPSPPSLSAASTPHAQQAAEQQARGMQPFARVSSAGSLTSYAESAASPTRPPLERGKSEPIKHLQDKVRNLSAQHLRQMEELDKQKTIAEVQYSELLMQVIPQQQQAKAGPSEEQRHALQSVLSDPSLVKILRSVLLTGQPPMDSGRAGQAAGASPPLIAPATHMQAREGSEGATPPLTQVGVGQVTTPPLMQVAVGQGFPQPVLSPVDILSPTHPAGMADMKGQFMSPNGPSPCPPSPSTSIPGAFGEASPPPSMSGLLASGADISPTQTMLKKFKNARNLSSSEKEVYKEIRRQSHISAEQKRRGSIKQGFDYLQMLVINASAYPSGKVSKAMILEKTLEHIQKYHQERDNREKQMEALKARIEELNAAIALCQEKLPASGAPITRQRFEENRQRFGAYVQKRSLQNYKFGVFSIVIQQLFESYNSMVSTGTVDELCRTVLAWFEQNCTLPSLRPVVMNSLKELSLKTSILSDPSQVPRQLMEYAQVAHDQQEQDMRTRRQQQQLQQQQQQQQQSASMDLYTS